MQLHTYFTLESRKKLSDHEKFSLYQKIMAQRNRTQQTLARHWLIKKRFLYGILTSVLIFVFFGTFFRDRVDIEQYRAFFVQKNPEFSAVNANQVWEIIAINWEYVIEKEGKQFQNSILFNGDLITLKDKAKIIFNINKETKVEVSGPAQFIISQKAADRYLLRLIDGSFLKVDAATHEDIIEVETWDLTIQTQKNQEIALEISKHQQHLQVKNNGAPLLVHTKSSSTKTELANSKILTMQENDITKIEDIERFQQILAKDNNITHTFVTKQTLDLNDDMVAWELALLVSENHSIDALPLVNPQEATALVASLDYQTDQKKVPSEEQISQLTAALNKQFLLSDISMWYDAHYSQNQDIINSSTFLILSRLQSIADRYELPSISTTLSVEQAIDQLLKGLEGYHIPPSKLQQLKTLKERALFLNKNSLDTDWENFKTQLPWQLIFN